DAFQLNAVIDRLSPEKLVSITKSICEKCPAARELFSDSLFVSESEVPNSGAARAGASSTGNNESEREITSSAKSVNLKRKQANYDLCVNCEKKFDVTENSPNSCSYHPANMW
ncbi:hypothetical protein N7481_003366, partial [Penicillium waksmanii]|uniref:uncharacterized protein n=1 Tax=Penicillium waksmanii TaxID=69791 RepID=UPI00254803A9